MPVCNDLFGEKTIFILSAGLLGCWRGGWGLTLNTLKGLKPITRYKHGVYLNDRPIILPRSYFLVVATCFKVVLMAYVNFSHKTYNLFFFVFLVFGTIIMVPWPSSYPERVSEDTSTFTSNLCFPPTNWLRRDRCWSLTFCLVWCIVGSRTENRMADFVWFGAREPYWK